MARRSGLIRCQAGHACPRREVSGGRRRNRGSRLLHVVNKRDRGRSAVRRIVTGGGGQLILMVIDQIERIIEGPVGRRSTGRRTRDHRKSAREILESDGDGAHKGRVRSWVASRSGKRRGNNDLRVK